MKNFVYLIAILAVMFIASATKAEHNRVVINGNEQSVRSGENQQIKIQIDTAKYVRHVIRNEVGMLAPRPQKF